MEQCVSGNVVITFISTLRPILSFKVSANDQAVSRRSLTAKAPVRSPVSSYEVCG